MPFFGSTVNLGSSDRATFIRKVALSHFQPCIRAGDVGIDRAVRDQPVEQQLRIDAGDDALRAPRFAARDHARRAAVGDDHFLDRRVEHDVDARLAAGARHRLGDRAHAADRMAPGAGHARRFAEQMVEQDVGGARRLRRREIADHAVEPEQRLGQIALEMAVEDLGCAAHREIVDDAGLGQRQPGHVAAEARAAWGSR